MVGQLVDATTPVGGFARLADRVVDRGRFAGVDNARHDSLRNACRADDLAAIVVETNQIVRANASSFRVTWIDTSQPVVVAIDLRAVIVDIVNDAVLAVAERVKTVTRVRGDQLNRVFFY